MITFIITTTIVALTFHFFYKDTLRDKDDQIYRWQKEFEERFNKCKELELEVSELRKDLDTLRKISSNRWEHISAEEIVEMLQKSFNKN